MVFLIMNSVDTLEELRMLMIKISTIMMYPFRLGQTWSIKLVSDEDL